MTPPPPARDRGRRAKGEGSVYQERSTGRWIASVDLGWKNGRRNRPRRVAATEAEALVLRDQLKADHGLGIALDERQTVKQFLEAWLADVVKPMRRPKTYAAYEYQVRMHLVPTLGPLQLRRLTGQQVQRLVNDLARSGKSPATVHQAFRVLRTAMEKAREWRLVRENPVEFVEPPRVRKRADTVLDAEGARRFIEAVEPDRLFPLYVLAITTALRQGELLGLSWPDVDLDAATLEVRVQLQRVDGAFRLVDPKSESTRRTVALAPFAVEVLRRQQTRQKEDRLRAGRLWQHGLDRALRGLVFTTQRGNPLFARNVYRDFTGTLARCVVCHERAAAAHDGHAYAPVAPPMRWHDLRHTGVTILAAENVPPRDLQRYAGHANPSTTMRIYAAPLDEGQRRAAATMERALRPR